MARSVVAPLARALSIAGAISSPRIGAPTVGRRTAFARRLARHHAAISAKLLPTALRCGKCGLCAGRNHASFKLRDRHRLHAHAGRRFWLWRMSAAR
jgi:hypothetical protein